MCKPYRILFVKIRHIYVFNKFLVIVKKSSPKNLSAGSIPTVNRQLTNSKPTPELFQIFSRIQGKDITNEEVDALSYDEKCKMLNLNPDIVAKHFQYRVETFLTEVPLSKSEPIGKIVYYALCIEFQMRGSPHLHALIWTEASLKLTSETKEAYIEYI